MTARDVVDQHADGPVCHLATLGRRSGRWRVTEISFAAEEDRLYLLAGSGDRAQWVRSGDQAASAGGERSSPARSGGQ